MRFDRVATRAALSQIDETTEGLIREAIVCGIAWGREHPESEDAAIPVDRQPLPRELEIVVDALATRWKATEPDYGYDDDEDYEDDEDDW